MASARSGVPAILRYTYSAGGRVLSAGSPLSSIFGTRYQLDDHGRIASVGTTSAATANIATDLEYRAFGPLTGLKTRSIQPAGTSERQLTLRNSYRTDYSLASQTWSLEHVSGPPVSAIALLAQSFGYTAAGLMSRRIDSADSVASRVYGYDALLRLTCEARGDRAGAQPDISDCALPKTKLPWTRMPDAFSRNPTATKVRATPRVAGLFTYGNGQSAQSPQDVRLTSYVQAEDESYLSPSVEVSSYAHGSSQVLGITRAGGDLVLGHDALGRRVFDFDSRDPVRSRRDYAYLPNGQLGEISVPAPDGTRSEHAMRYDERGRPVLIRALRIPGGVDTYELFWDDADRLIAANINFTPTRATLTSARWHYHYAGSTLIAATRELVGSDPDVAGVKRFWVISDERGLVHRLVDEEGATLWQAHWDASGWGTLVGQPQPEMWVPFGLPGQVVLGQTVVHGDAGSSVLPGTEARADAGGTWIRPPIALNRWRAVDPYLGVFLQPDPSDSIGRTDPEGYSFALNSPMHFADPTGLEASRPFSRQLRFDDSCGITDRIALNTAAAWAWGRLSTCRFGYCAQLQGRRKWLGEIYSGTISCPKTRTADDLPITADGVASDLTTALTPVSTLNGFVDADTEIYPLRIAEFYQGGTGLECLAKEFAHERLHAVTSLGFALTDVLSHSTVVKRYGISGLLRWVGHRRGGAFKDEEENLVRDAASRCFSCDTASVQEGPHPIVFEE